MYDVVFIDDDVRTAREYAEQVSRFTRLRTLVVAQPAEAVEAVRTYRIAIAVLDQKMPEISGTELFAELRQHAPALRGIMLSGEADASEIGDAMNLGYTKYLHKSRFRQLPALVLNEFSKSQTEFAKAADFKPILLAKASHYLGLAGSTEFWLEGLTVEAASIVPESSWKLIDTINSGEKKQIVEKYEVSEDIKFEESLESKLSGDIGVSLKVAGAFKSNLSSSIANKLKLAHTLSGRVTREVKKDITLPAEPTDPTALYVRSRAFLWAPTFRRIVCNIVRRIKPHGEQIVTALSVLQPMDQVATKQVDILSDGSRKELATHIFNL